MTDLSRRFTFSVLAPVVTQDGRDPLAGGLAIAGPERVLGVLDDIVPQLDERRPKPTILLLGFVGPLLLASEGVVQIVVGLFAAF
jgi:hypothetical protein